MKIEILPSSHDTSLKLKLEGLLLNCISFKCCVAFWTIDDNFLSYEALSTALRKKDSFICVDIEKPTNIDNLASFHRKGVTEIYLHKYRIASPNHVENTNLLHSKIYIFEIDNDNVEIWVGSHNLTVYSISGLNIETSTSIKCSKNDVFYLEILTLVNTIRNEFCFKFNFSLIDIYKKLQSRSAQKTSVDFKIENVVTLVGFDLENLDNEGVIQLLSFNSKDLKILQNEDGIIIHCFDLSQRKEFLFKCIVKQTGVLDEKIEKLKIDFINERRFAYVGTGMLSLLKPETKIDDTILKSIKSFINIDVVYKIPNFHILSKPEKDFSFWHSDINGIYNKRVENDKQSTFKIQKATFDRDFIKNTVSLENDWSYFLKNHSGFYEELDHLIETEFSRAKLNNLEKPHKILEEFLNKVKSECEFPEYSKAIIERCIYGLTI